MEVKVIKPQKEVEWKFPCMGISKVNKLVVGFSGYERGVVLDIGNSDINSIHEVSYMWDMSKFEPIEQEKQPIDWDRIELPTLLFDRKENRNLFFVERFNIDTIYTVRFYDLIENKKIEWAFIDITKRNEFLNTLEIYPKGTKIEITL